MNKNTSETKDDYWYLYPTNFKKQKYNESTGYFFVACDDTSDTLEHVILAMNHGII